jgi:hypothetical protein
VGVCICDGARPHCTAARPASRCSRHPLALHHIFHCRTLTSSCHLIITLSFLHLQPPRDLYISPSSRLHNSILAPPLLSLCASHSFATPIDGWSRLAQGLECYTFTHPSRRRETVYDTFTFPSLDDRFSFPPSKRHPATFSLLFLSLFFVQFLSTEERGDSIDLAALPRLHPLLLLCPLARLITSHPILARWSNRTAKLSARLEEAAASFPRA